MSVDRAKLKQDVRETPTQNQDTKRRKSDAPPDAQMFDLAAPDPLSVEHAKLKQDVCETPTQNQETKPRKSDAPPHVHMLDPAALGAPAEPSERDLPVVSPPAAQTDTETDVVKRSTFEATLTQEIGAFSDPDDYPDQLLSAVIKDGLACAKETHSDPEETRYWRERVRDAIRALKDRGM